MRISEQRYARDRQALDVATRLIDFEARTSTIRELTGMTDDRIRKLSKACGVDGRSGPRQRRRGASPSRVGNLLSKARSKNEAAALAGLCQLMGITSESEEFDPIRGINRVSRAERLCDAFWTFRYLLPHASIGFEHMLLLLSEAAKGEDLAIAHCENCTALLVVDPLSLCRSLCAHCVDVGPAKYMSESTQSRHVAEESAVYK